MVLVCLTIPSLAKAGRHVPSPRRLLPSTQPRHCLDPPRNLLWPHDVALLRGVSNRLPLPTLLIQLTGLRLASPKRPAASFPRAARSRRCSCSTILTRLMTNPSKRSHPAALCLHQGTPLTHPVKPWHHLTITPFFSRRTRPCALRRDIDDDDDGDDGRGKDTVGSARRRCARSMYSLLSTATLTTTPVCTAATGGTFLAAVPPSHTSGHGRPASSTRRPRSLFRRRPARRPPAVPPLASWVPALYLLAQKVAQKGVCK